MHRLLVAASAALAVASPAAAHIVLAQPQAQPGAYYVAAFRVSHGCDGSPTTMLHVTLPEGVTAPKPRAKPGWEVAVADGGVTWRGRLDDASFDLFEVMVRLPETSGPLYFPAVQSCETGERRWAQIPEPGAAWTSVPTPAPVLNLTTPSGEGEHAHH